MPERGYGITFRNGGGEMHYKLLVVDDEPLIRGLLKDHFEAEGYLVYTAQDAKQAEALLGKKPDLVLLDIAMPDVDGITFCTGIRKELECPILFLTAKGELQDKLIGLRAGGDDYIVKPFSMEELTARVEAHLRREERVRLATDKRFADGLVIDYSARTVAYRGRRISVSRKEFDIIELLSMNAGIVFGREMIYERLWGYEAEGDSLVVKEHIRRLRSKLEAVSGKQYIETVWGVGYRWVRM